MKFDILWVIQIKYVGCEDTEIGKASLTVTSLKDSKKQNMNKHFNKTFYSLFISSLNTNLYAKKNLYVKKKIKLSKKMCCSYFGILRYRI